MEARSLRGTGQIGEGRNSNGPGCISLSSCCPISCFTQPMKSSSDLDTRSLDGWA